MKRFYKRAEAQAVEGGWQVKLDGRAVMGEIERKEAVVTSSMTNDKAQEESLRGALLPR